MMTIKHIAMYFSSHVIIFQQHKKRNIYKSARMLHEETCVAGRGRITDLRPVGGGSGIARRPSAVGSTGGAGAPARGTPTGGRCA
jgi:hypothetical protein